MWLLSEISPQIHIDSFMYCITLNQMQIPFLQWQSTSAMVPASLWNQQPQAETRNDLSHLHEELFFLLA